MTRPGMARRLLASGAIILAGTMAACGDGGRGAARVVVPRGAGLAQAADSLASAGVVRSATLFRLYARFRGSDRPIKAGTYRFDRGASYGFILEAMRAGKGMVLSVTIPEGYTVAQIAQVLSRRLGVPPDSVHAAVRDTALLHELDIPTPTAEGYLFPDTYTFLPGTTARAAVGVMVRRFEMVWRPEWTARLDTLTMTRHDILTLASIVEREARLAEERPVIAAVYMNRLRDGMLLQADPTVQYALPEYQSRLLYRHLAIESPYNTYKYKGLPPGPIGAPGRASIEASLYPANVPYKFFVAYPDGHHEFRRTLAEHNVARVAARRAWDSATVAARARAAAGAAAAAARPTSGMSPALRDSALRDSTTGR